MRHDVIALFSGILCIILLLAGMWIWGIVDDWNEESGYTHCKTNSSSSCERFMPEPYGCNDTSVPGRNHTGCTGTWYYWKLPPVEATATTRAVVWLMYSLHQIFIWGLIYRAQLVMEFNQSKVGNDRYSTNLRWFNWAMLAVNGLFHILHLIQTHTTYDATAQDVSISSSQASVIMMLCFILLMEYKDRGLLFMWPNPRSDGKIANALRLHPGPIKLIRKYHGIAFSWASIYTFWYHPMENTWGHTLGFFHTAIVMLQGSLVFTEIHLNRYWRLLNECWVIIHATTIAVQTGNPAKLKSDLWPIFTFGFGFIFAFTQVFSFPFWKKLPSWVRVVPVVIYFAIVCVLCGTVVWPKEPGQSGFARMYEMVFIPAEEYLQVLVSWLFLFLFIVVESKVKSSPSDTKLDEVEGNSMKNAGNQLQKPSATKQAFYLCCVIILYAIMILFSHLYKEAHTGINMTSMMIAFVLFYSIFACITIIMFKQLMGPSKPLLVRKTSKVESSEEKDQPTMYQNTSLQL